MFATYYGKKLMRQFFYISLFVFSNFLYAATINVTADYKPASYETDGGRFISTTKCNNYQPGLWINLCTGGVQELDNLLFDINMAVSRESSEDVTDPKDSLVYIASSGKRNINLTSSEGNHISALFEPTMLGEYFKASIPKAEGDNIFYHGLYPVGGCSSFKYNANYFDDTYRYWIVLWKNVEGNSCHNKISYNINTNIDRILYGFKISPSSPLSIPNGTYNGKITLTVGPGGDIDLGNGTYSDTKLEINLTLTVRHQLKIEFPKGDGEGRNKLTLLPPGGWANWIHIGKSKPNVLERDLPYRLWTSGTGFFVTLRCEYISGEECALKNSKGHQVTLNTYYIDRVDREHKLTINPLKIDVNNTIIISALRKIKFRVTGDAVSEMMEYPGSTYKGDVTLIYDAAID